MRLQFRTKIEHTEVIILNGKVVKADVLTTPAMPASIVALLEIGKFYNVYFAKAKDQSEPLTDNELMELR